MKWMRRMVILSLAAVGARRLFDLARSRVNCMRDVGGQPSMVRAAVGGSWDPAVGVAEARTEYEGPSEPQESLQDGIGW